MSAGLRCCRGVGGAGNRFTREMVGAQYLTDVFAGGYLPVVYGAFQEADLNDFLHVHLLSY